MNVALSATGNAIIVDPTEYSLFTPQEGYFNLYTSYEADGYPKNPNCVSIESDGMMSITGGGSCSGDNRNYVCKRG